MADVQPNGVDVDVEVAGQKVVLKNVKSFNTIISTASAVGVGFAIYLLLYPVSNAIEQHRTEAAKGSEAFVTAIRDQTKAIIEQTAAQREATCLLRFDQKDRPGNADFCKAVSGATR